MIFTEGPTFFSTASLIVWKCGQGNPIGFPFLMQDAKAIISAPRSTSIFARVTAFFPEHPPQERNPTISTGPVSSNAKVPSCVTLKSVVPGHISSVSLHRMIPHFCIENLSCLLVTNNLVSDFDLLIQRLHIGTLDVFTFIHTVDEHAFPSSC